MSRRFVTAAEYAYHEIYRRIIHGEIPPGERINQDAEAERLELSRMPVREAIRRLASEGFVTINAHRGAVVRPLSVEDFQDLYELRIALEGLAGRLGSMACSERELNRMRALIPEMEQVVERGDLDAWLNVDWTFHCILYEVADRPRLMRLIRQFREEARRYRLLGLSFPNELSVSLRDHFEILAALERGDHARVEVLIGQAIAESQSKVAERLREYDFSNSGESQVEKVGTSTK